MKRASSILVLTALIALTAAAAAGCSCSVTGGEGDKAVDVSMGGKVIAADRLSFQPVSYSAQTLTIRNTASEHELAIGRGTPILEGNGDKAAAVTGEITIAAGETGTLRLDAPLAVGGKYYLGSPPQGGKPSLRQLFLCPGAEGGGGGGPNVPDVPDVPDVDVGE